MSSFKKSILCIAVLYGAAAIPALAGSSTSSAASEGGSASVGSLSTSIQKSSNSSSKGTDVAAGEYKVIEIAAATDRPGTLRITLQSVADASADGELALYLPQAAADRGQLAAGQIVTASQRPYGLEFANGEPRQAFFLVLADDWYRELQTRVVTL
jgi:hypothetical protein